MPSSTLFQLYPCFSGISVSKTPHNICSKQLTAFPNSYDWSTGGQRNWIPVIITSSILRRKFANQGIEPVTRSQVLSISVCPDMITLYSIDTHFDTSKTNSFENIVGKEEIARKEQFLLFPQSFLLNQVIVSSFVQILTSYLYLLLNRKSPKLPYEVKG